MSDSAPLLRLARRVHMRALVTSGWRRMLHSVPAALQITIAAVAAYAIAHWVLGHATPIIAVTVTITTLGLSRDARPRKVLETSIGITVGIALSELVILVVGKGAWQLAIVLFATLAVTRALSANPAFAIAAAVQSGLVVLLPDPAGGAFTRSLDGLVAGVVALAVTALIPRDPRKAATRDAKVLFSVFKESLDGLVEGIARADHPATELALERLRRTQSMVDDWTSALDTAISISQISPWMRRQLPELRMQARVLTGADLTARHLRSIARRVTVLVEDGQERPELAQLMGQLATGIRLLGQQVEDRDLAGAARAEFESLAKRLDPAVIVPGGALRESVVVVLMRPLVVDLLVATGMDAEAARALLPEVAD
jgi:uncharacterized membrane protein YgaE (UPF0421/DUF939 family)